MRLNSLNGSCRDVASQAFQLGLLARNQSEKDTYKLLRRYFFRTSFLSM